MPDSPIGGIAAILRVHRPCIDNEVGTEPFWCGDDDDIGCGTWDKLRHPLWRDHIAAAVTAGRTITTVEQLAALPFLSIIREIFKPSPGSGIDYGGVYERRTSGWHAIAGVYSRGLDNGAPRLSVLVIWNPEWANA
jgi:hypothetical protein